MPICFSQQNAKMLQTFALHEHVMSICHVPKDFLPGQRPCVMPDHCPFMATLPVLLSSGSTICFAVNNCADHCCCWDLWSRAARSLPARQICLPLHTSTLAGSSRQLAQDTCRRLLLAETVLLLRSSCPAEQGIFAGLLGAGTSSGAATQRGRLACQP